VTSRRQVSLCICVNRRKKSYVTSLYQHPQIQSRK
jgi:hypothetical protein